MEGSFPWAILVSAFTGGAAGAIITALATSARNKRELALSITDRYIDPMFAKIAEAGEALASRTRMAEPAAWNCVANVANWFEVVAACYLKGLADAAILESMGLPDKCKQFYAAMSRAEQEDASGNVTRAFDETALARLTYLRRLEGGEVPGLGEV